MTTQTKTNGTTTCTKPRGFRDIPCLKCGECGGVSVYLEDANTFRCGSCEEEFTRDEIEELLAKWTPVLAWLDAMPECE